MSRSGADDTNPRDPGDGLILEGAPPGSSRPSWLGLRIVVLVTLAVGSAIGYGVAVDRTPMPSPTLGALASERTRPTATPGAVFIKNPCSPFGKVPMTLLPGHFASVTGFLIVPSALRNDGLCSIRHPGSSASHPVDAAGADNR